MSCSPFDLRDYFMGELAEKDRRQVDVHARGCAPCRDEIERLRATGTALLTLRDEEIPQRIGFISDRIFKPSLASRLWTSSARLAFGSAAMLSAALLVFTFYRPAVAPAQVNAAAVQAAVHSAVAQTEAQDATLLAAAEKRFEDRVKASEKRFDEQRRMDMLNVAEMFSVMQKRTNVSLVAANRIEP